VTLPRIIAVTAICCVVSIHGCHGNTSMLSDGAAYSSRPAFSRSHCIARVDIPVLTSF
jgi:hypothetical protein